MENGEKQRQLNMKNGDDNHGNYDYTKHHLSFPLLN